MTDQEEGPTLRRPAALPGTLAERYRLDGPLGRGGFADVFAATDVDTGRPVAVKVLRVAGRGDDERMVREAQLLSGLVHPGIVRLLEAGTVDGRPFLVMERIDGLPLSEVIARGPCPEDEVRLLGARLAEALAFAHDRGVVHRDVKPSNVLVDGEGHPHLVDFGIARMVDVAAITATGELLGTPAYLAPEQVAGEEVTGAADVYALGLVLAEAVTGQRVFEGSIDEVMGARLARSAPIPAAVPASLRPTLLRATDRRPEHRPSAAELAGQLRSAATSSDGAVAAVVDQPTVRDVPIVATAPAVDAAATVRGVPAVPARGERPSESATSTLHGLPAAAGAARPAGETSLVGGIGPLAAGAAASAGPLADRLRDLDRRDGSARIDPSVVRVYGAVAAAALLLFLVVGLVAAGASPGPPAPETESRVLVTTTTVPATTEPPPAAGEDEKKGEGDKDEGDKEEGDKDDDDDGGGGGKGQGNGGRD